MPNCIPVAAVIKWVSKTYLTCLVSLSYDRVIISNVDLVFSDFSVRVFYLFFC